MADVRGDRVNHLLSQFRLGDETAAQALWDRFHPRISALARSRLPRRQRRVEDDEDIAIVVLDRLLAGIDKGSFDSISDGDELWALLKTMTLRVTANVRRAASRDPTQTRNRVTVSSQDDQLTDNRSTDSQPFDAAAQSDSLAAFFEKLSDRHREVVRLRVSGYTVDDIAAELGITPRSVSRRLREVRKHASATSEIFDASDS